jgi:hypothetical protein
MTMKKKPFLSAVGYMESGWVRYLIQDERGRYWTGRGFTKEQRKALAYADERQLGAGRVRFGATRPTGPTLWPEA